MGLKNPTHNKTISVLTEVFDERTRQEKKWGAQNHSPAEWLMILGEEVGEANKAALEHKFSYAGKSPLEHLKHYREELIQVAAVAVAMIESVDRNEIYQAELAR